MSTPPKKPEAPVSSDASSTTKLDAKALQKLVVSTVLTVSEEDDELSGPNPPPPQDASSTARLDANALQELVKESSGPVPRAKKD